MTPDPTSQPNASGGLSRRVFAGAFWIMAGRVLSIFALFASNTLLSVRLTDAEFSAYILASFLLPFFALLANLGTPEILMREVRASLVAGDPRRARQAVTASFAICGAASAIVGAGLVALFAVASPQKAHWAMLQQQMGWVALWIVAQTASQVAGEACRGAGAFGLAIALYTKSGGWVSNALSAGAVFALWPRATPVSLNAVMAIQVAATALPAVLGAGVLYRLLSGKANVLGLDSNAPPLPADRPRQPAPTIAWMLRESWPIFVSYAVIIGIEQLDILVVGLLATDSELADYGIAKRWLSVVNFVFVSLAPAITPFVAELYHQGDMARLQKLMRGAATVVAAPTIAACVVLFVAAYPAVMLFGEQRLGAVDTLRVQLAGQALLALAGHSYLALSMSGHQRQLMYCSLIVGAVYLMIGPAATYAFGIVGAGAAKSIAVAARAAIAAVLVHRALGIWTVASLSPTVLRDSFRILFTRLRRIASRRRQTTVEPSQV